MSKRQILVHFFSQLLNQFGDVLLANLIENIAAGAPSHISELDILIGSRDKKAQILIEVEERSCSPKKILGNLFASLLCDRFEVKTKDGPVCFMVTSETRLIVCGIQPGHGKRIDKIDRTIVPRLHALSSTPNEILPKNISLIFDESLEFTLELVKEEIADALKLSS